MEKPSPILSSDTSGAHLMAQGVLSALALATVLAVIWAAGHGSDEGREEPAESTPALLSALKTLSSNMRPAQAPAPGQTTSPSQTASGQKATSSPGQENSGPVSPSVPAGQELKNPQVIEAVETARAVRRLGDTAAALESLRTADLRTPNHPEIIGEMALTYEAMGLRDKSAAAWRSVVLMGEETAGGYYTLAKSKLDPSGGAEENAAPLAAGVSLGPCQVIRDPAVKEGERITVRVPILTVPGTVVDPAKMDIHVFLFEAINDGEQRIEQVRAATPAHNWVSAPVDWKEPAGEAIDVTYDLTPGQPGEVRDSGKRSFYGFIVKLFYQNRLVGEQAEPESLLELTRATAAPALENALFPK